MTKENDPGFRVDELWIYVGIDVDDDEGVMAFKGPDGSWIPMVAADASRRDTLKPIADRLVEVKGGRYDIRHFRRDIDEADRQMLIRGLAVQSLRSPGFEYACREISKQFAGEGLFDGFRTDLADVEPAR